MSPTISRRLITAAILFTLAVLFAGCLDLEDLDSPRIASMTITPSTISQGSTGMTDEFFTITIVTENFTEPLESVEVQIQENNREAQSTQAPRINGNTIVLERVTLSWFQGLEPGDYAISASVFSEGELQNATEQNLATVTVTP